MMASKHLDFSVENIVMIIFAIALIILENKRSKKLQYLDKKQENDLTHYKEYAYNLFKIEILIVLSISVWMWI
jgi:hypothetical protein